MGLKDKLEQTRQSVSVPEPMQSDIVSSQESAEAEPIPSSPANEAPLPPPETDLVVEKTREVPVSAKPSSDNPEGTPVPGTQMPPVHASPYKAGVASIPTSSGPAEMSDGSSQETDNSTLDEEQDEDWAEEKAMPKDPWITRQVFISRARMRGSRVVLRTLQTGDAQHIWRWIARNRIVNKLGLRIPVSREEIDQWIVIHRSDQIRDQRVYILEQEDSIPIGMAGFCNIEDSARRAEFFILIGDPEYLGNHYGSEAARLLLEYGFQYMNLNRIESFVLSDDERSLSSLQKSGFKKEGELYEYVFIDGEYRNVFILSLLKKEYNQIPSETPDEDEYDAYGDEELSDEDESA